MGNRDGNINMKMDNKDNENVKMDNTDGNVHMKMGTKTDSNVNTWVPTQMVTLT